MLAGRPAPAAHPRGRAHDLPPLPRPRQRPPPAAAAAAAAAASHAPTHRITGTGNRWAQPPTLGDSEADAARRSAPGVLDDVGPHLGAPAVVGHDGAALPTSTDGFQTALGARQKKRQRQRAARRAAGDAQRQPRHDHDGDRRDDADGDAMELSSDDGSLPEAIPPPFQEPPLTRLHLVSHVAKIQKKVVELEARQAPLGVQERARKRLEDTQHMLRQAGGATERRMLFAIMSEEDKIRRLLVADKRNLDAIAAAEAERDKLDKRIANLRVGSSVIARKLDNSRQRRAYLSAQNAAEAIPAETTTTVHQALEQILLAVGPSLAGEASVLAEYFRKVAPLPARLPGGNQDADLSECETFLDPEEEFPPEDLGGDPNRASSSADGAAPSAPTQRTRGNRATAACAPMLPDRMPENLLAASQLVEDLRRQRMQAVEATYEKRDMHVDELPSLSGPQVVDKFDAVLKIAIDNLESVRSREEHLAQPQVPPLRASPGLVAPPSPPLQHQEPPAKHHRQSERRRTRWETEASADLPASTLPAQMPMVDLCPGCGAGPMPEAALIGCCVCCAAVCGDCTKGGLEEINSCLYCHGADQQSKQMLHRQPEGASDPMDVSEPRSPRSHPACASHDLPRHDPALPPPSTLAPTADQLLDEQLAAQRRGQQQAQLPLADATAAEEEL